MTGQAGQERHQGSFPVFCLFKGLNVMSLLRWGRLGERQEEGGAGDAECDRTAGHSGGHAECTPKA